MLEKNLFEPKFLNFVFIAFKCLMIYPIFARILCVCVWIVTQMYAFESFFLTCGKHLYAIILDEIFILFLFSSCCNFLNHSSSNFISHLSKICLAYIYNCRNDYIFVAKPKLSVFFFCSLFFLSFCLFVFVAVSLKQKNKNS